MSFAGDVSVDWMAGWMAPCMEIHIHPSIHPSITDTAFLSAIDKYIPFRSSVNFSFRCDLVELIHITSYRNRDQDMPACLPLLRTFYYCIPGNNRTE